MSDKAENLHTRFVPGPKLSKCAIEEWTQMMKRPNPVYMRQMDHEFSVETNEGVLTAHAGDYVAHDPISGHFWPVSNSYVEQHYDVIEVRP